MSNPRYHLLSNAVVIRATGRPIERFLQNRLTNDLRLADQRRAIRAGAITAQGRTEGLFTVIRQSATEFLLLSDGGIVDDLRAALLRFKVTEQVDCIHESTYIAAHALDIPETLLHVPPGTKEYQVERLGEVVGIWRNRFGVLGMDLVGVPEQVERKLADLGRDAIQVGEVEATALRITSGKPIYPDEISADVLLAEAPLEDAISYTKGCYVGQEVMAKIDALGKAPRKILSLRIDGGDPVPYATPVVSGEGRSVGKILTTAVRSDSVLAFSIVRNDEDILNGMLTVLGRPASWLRTPNAV